MKYIYLILLIFLSNLCLSQVSLSSGVLFQNSYVNYFLDTSSDKNSFLEVYSLNQLIGSATKACRIRRDSDNAEIDIGFDANGIFDVASKNTFKGGSNVFITKLYGQKNHFDMVQTTASFQPPITDTDFSFDGSTEYFLRYSGTLINYTGGGSIYFIVSQHVDPGAGNVFMSMLNCNNGTNEILFSGSRFGLGGFYGQIFNTNLNFYSGAISKSLNTYYVLNFDWVLGSAFTTTTTNIVFNGTNNTPYIPATPGITNWTGGIPRTEIGKEQGNFAPYYFNGRMKAILIANAQTNNSIISPTLGKIYKVY